MGEQLKSVRDDFIDKAARAPRWVVSAVTAMICTVFMPGMLFVFAAYMTGRDNSREIEALRNSLSDARASASVVQERLSTVEGKLSSIATNIEWLVRQSGGRPSTTPP